MKRICVFLGSSSGVFPEYKKAAHDLGAAIAKQNIGLVYGGGNVGLMDVLANSALDNGGEVIGVIPEVLHGMDVFHSGLTELRVVKDMHERKAVMADLSDGFIALPGGIGTLEELAEALTWSQLKIHLKPCGLLDVRNYFAPLIRFLDQAVDQGFLNTGHRSILIRSENPEDLLTRLNSWRPPVVKKWIERKAK